ncbi:uncharacterized protein Z518_02148 [Rhinocladiella mackenziei CBS 650.93]|uniref:Rhinocladiella mackenziei CBS 650.93 unplaced genomic scaffold supercont1.2, whole genome shotgun sequence n=1 Tax=Rhinocladiella mackenziei CBS 650.93 TaxID=1442369 RepID=A0A0D2JEA4_9EURO|nr:uncharacterized protein Z518_02148 [Rhinocladiella mackenziei CBS 650.93]KIX07495.1 hypothetical protein Z518_02148 [Rhinocladiella mackenziei CBS 650.93]
MGLYGADDELGTINRLTKDVVLAAAKSEIQTGERFSLNWPLDALGQNMIIGRKPFSMEQFNKAPRVVNDDIWHFNSQGSTQWDGLRHFAYQKEAKFYNGVALGDMFDDDGSIKSHRNGVDRWEKKGIVGRGILVDYDRWRRAHGVEYNVLPPTAVEEGPTPTPLEHLKAVLKWQGTDVRFGDILVLRTGFVAAYNAASEDERRAVSKSVKGSGVEQSEEALAWLWENFAAVAGDHVSFEKWPSVKPWYMHEVLLAGWGMPIGEPFDCEALAEHCAKVKRWSFFLTSEVCHVPGAVASPPNALAIF